MKKLIALILGIILFLPLISCGKEKNSVAGKTYIYEKDGFGGNFEIHMNEDGTFSYSEGELSSHWGLGKWSIRNSVITLTENDGRVNRFDISGDDLVFIEEGSDNFLYVKVKNGEGFRGVPLRTFGDEK